MDPSFLDSSLRKCSKIRDMDRLSSLPNELLIRILSLMPTKSAVVVCLLLKKRALPWITSLDFDASPVHHCLKYPNQIERFPSFKDFVDSVLQSHQSPYLTRFRLILGDYKYRSCFGKTSFYFDFGHDEGCLPHLKSTQINAWITFPLTRYGLRELDLHIHLRGPPCQTLMPPEVFTKETLEVLKLDVNLSFDGISIFRLPNLKTLHLYAFLISEDAFLTNLVSSCPVLEELKVSAGWNHVRFTKMISSSLRSLSLFVKKMEGEESSDLVVLDTPNLEALVYNDNPALQFSITRMPCLAKAEIDFDFGSWVPLETICQQMLILISALSNVRYLRLDGACSTILDSIKTKKQLPVFRDLLLLEIRRVERKALVAFLYRSPNLETLVILGGLEYFHTRRLTLATIPWCLRYNLKRIVVYGYYGREKEIRYIKFLLKYSLVLEELVLSTTDLTINESTLENIPRASQTCSVQLHYSPPFCLYPRLH